MHLHAPSSPGGTPRQRIITAAADLFARRGYAATTTRAIAEAAGVNEVTLFRQFGTKAGVLAAIGEELRQGTADAEPSSGGIAVEPTAASTAALQRDAAAGEPAQAGPAGGVDAGVRTTLLALARAEVDRVARFGPAALRLALDAADSPEVAEALGSSAGPAANLGRLAELFAGWQASGEVRDDVAPALLAEGFAMLTGTLLMSRQLLQPGLDADPAADLDALVGVFCDGIALHAGRAVATPVVGDGAAHVGDGAAHLGGGSAHLHGTAHLGDESTHRPDGTEGVR